jgi:hypothetical protein
MCKLNTLKTSSKHKKSAEHFAAEIKNTKFFKNKSEIMTIVFSRLSQPVA